MTTIYRKSADWLTVSEAKRLLIDALPTQDAVDFFVMPDGSIKVERNQESKLGAPFVDGDFIGACEKIGIKPRMTHRPAITDYKATDYDDVIYSITHEEFVRYAELHGVSVEVEQPAQVARPAPAAQVEPVQAGPAMQTRAMKRRALIDEFRNEWPSIEDDLREASRNGLDSAKLPKHGMWDADKAMAWAKSQGKLTKQITGMEPATWCGPVIRHQSR